MVNMVTGREWRAIREEVLRLNQQQFADAIGTSRQRVSRVERNKAEYTFSELSALQDRIGLPLTYLLNIDHNPPAWLSLYATLDKSQQRQLDGFILAAIKLLK